MEFKTILALGKNIGDGKNLLGGAHFHLGCIYRSLGEREKAEREFQNCLKLVPDHKKARENLNKLKEKNKKKGAFDVS